MIVEPDFPDHWKTHLLIALLDGDESAPMCMIRLWAHCQNRKQWIFKGLSNGALKAICRYSGDADKFSNALVESGFVDIDGDTLTIHGWAETNAKLVRNWDNGGKGGRPKKITQQKPKDNPNKTQTKPNRNPTGTDREDREDKIKKPPKAPQGAKLILEYLNQKTGKDYRPVPAHLDLIRTRLKEPGVDIEGVKQMIDSKCSEWLRDAEMSKFLRPNTLFLKSKFSSYYDERNVKPKKPPTQNAGPQMPKKLDLKEPVDWKERVPENIAERGWDYLCTNDHDMARRLHAGESLIMSEPIDFGAMMRGTG